MRIKIDERQCQGFGLCAEVAAQLFKVGERDGYAIALVAELSDEQLQAAREAEAACPMRAIQIVE